MNNEIFHQKKNLKLTFISGNKTEQWQKNIEILNNCFYEFLFQELKIDYKPEQTFSLNLELVDEARIRQINKEFRDRDSVTDVLSFPQQENLRAGDYEFIAPENEVGDIMICEQICSVQAKEFDISFMEEFLHLAVHGFLHICGYDHELSDKEELLMEKLEQEILEKIKNMRAS